MHYRFEENRKLTWGFFFVYSPTRARDFEGEGGPETKQALYEEKNPGNDDVKSNVRQRKEPSGDTVPTDFGGELPESRGRNDYSGVKD